ncbi:MAG: ATP-dependent helicase [Eubacterium sp.]
MNFNKQQEETINAIEGNIAVIATAGSGKTTVLTHRIKNMIENYGILPTSILAITFSRKAKDNIATKLEDLKIHNANIETFHSLALKVISSAYGAKRFKVWTAQWEKEKLVQDICTSLQLCENDDVPYNEIFSFIALQKINMKYSIDDLIYKSDIPFKKDDMKRIYKMYEEYKDRNSYIEFDDFLNMANKVFDENEDILIKYQNIFKYVLVDEFQDVSLSQALLLRKLNNKNTMIVGDPLQAIYSFRGGDSKFILNFDTDYRDVKVINLNTNYRCSKDIVKTANKLALTIPDSKHKNYLESISYKNSFKVPELRHFLDDYEENEWIAKKITELKREGYRYNDIAILARTNAQLQKMETALHNANIAFDIID